MGKKHGYVSVEKAKTFSKEIFKISFGDMGSGIKGTLSRFTDSIRLCGAFNMLEGRDGIQRDLDRLESWASANLMGSTKPSARPYSWVMAIPDTPTAWAEK
ncbi:hypothetical protein HGM15179_012747 [Zosterops borbonicus]|uniref:Uncharacterized protein n=1 Tax=Zosterops borbonicus TaxID=364589 RepID=A0A8K1GAG0_9PASS|nr:hypothetical protein HGM15179_012746 [Zosterops borbonicus]TRZ14350.1 hypothetical protein HGM15179_012747 [Zosterops borbonicus]